MDIRINRIAAWLLVLALSISPAWADDGGSGGSDTAPVAGTTGAAGSGDGPPDREVAPLQAEGGTEEQIDPPGPLGEPPAFTGDEEKVDVTGAPALSNSLAREGDDPNSAVTRDALGLPPLDSMRSDDPNQPAFGNRNLIRQGDRMRNPSRVASYEQVSNNLATAGAVASVAIPAAQVARVGAAALGSGVRAAFSPKTVDLYRAVSPAEFRDIMATGAFRPAPGGNSLGVKQFGRNFEETLNLANKPIMSDTATIVRARVPESVARRMDLTPVDSSILRSGSVSVPANRLDMFNRSIRSIEQVY